MKAGAALFLIALSACAQQWPRSQPSYTAAPGSLPDSDMVWGPEFVMPLYYGDPHRQGWLQMERAQLAQKTDEQSQRYVRGIDAILKADHIATCAQYDGVIAYYSHPRPALSRREAQREMWTFMKLEAENKCLEAK